MSRDAIRKVRRSAPAAVLGAALVLGFAGSARAEEDEEEFSMENIPREYTAVESFFEFGTLFHNDDSYRFGDYTGLDEEQFYLIGNMDLRGRGAYDSPSAAFWRLRTDSIGQESRSILGEIGNQGLWNLALGFRQLPKLREDETLWFYAGDGDSALTLPPGFVSGGDNTTEISGFTNRRFEVDHQRDTYFANGGLRLAEDLWFRSSFARETKDGTHLTGAVVAATGGSPSALTVAEPIDWETRQGDAGFEYSTGWGQFDLNYYGSWFNNRTDGFSWQNAFTDPAWAAAAQSPAFATKGLAPDNRFDQVNFGSGYNLGDATHLSFDASWGRMQQDDTFLPYTGNPGLVVTVPLPETSADAQIDATFLRLGIVNRPLEKLTLNAGWRYDDRENDTPRRMFTYIIADGTDQDVTPANEHQRLNLPSDRRENELSAGARYEVVPRTDVLFDYRHQEIDRTYTEVDTTREDRYKVALNSRPLSWLTARAHVATGTRDGTHYFDNAPFVYGHNPAYLALPATEEFENNPALRRFYLADRERDEGSASVTLIPVESVNVDLRVDLAREHYDNTDVGLTDRDSRAYTIDLSWSATEAINTYAFYTREQAEIDQNGFDFTAAADLADPTRNWQYVESDVNDTVGFGIEAWAIPEKLSLNFETLFSQGVVDVDPRTGAFNLPALGFPNVNTTLYNFRVGGEYRLSPSTAVSMAYLFEKFDWDDWNYDFVTPTATADVYNTGEQTPDDRSSLFLFSVRYQFQ